MCIMSGLMLLVLEKLLKLCDMQVVAAGQGVHTCSLAACQTYVSVINMLKL